ncbi:hypothetical protein N473_06715 [Pseudoalteromonas luteoviolacea CPMOR-1]|uniref:GEVED domain-containing protein n=1 Tax=Pseudoalteromonas luteoviolacea CPMOR-1 TaxID=1365248 RepID=A0A167H2V6_9GAMM|nr:GEVED domain-containing protein [Pseudoalteromonas luteoviolacea]KZN57572.1 hypothetical protein N473_06715 [Pseudoalteromonas luteoviolacea CPMOR-1]
MKNTNLQITLPALTLLSIATTSVMANEDPKAIIQQAQYSELGDVLTVSQAQGRFAWLKKCYDGLLVELWEQMYDSRAIVPKEQKLNQLKALWLSNTKIAAGKAQYLTFANPDFSNPYDWYAGTSEAQACTTMPPEYRPIALKTTLLSRSYCENRSYDNDWEWIESVKVDKFEHASGSKSHTMVSGKVLTLSANKTVSFTITPGNEDPTFPSYVAARVWIDWNHNGQFDANERVYRGASDQPFTFNVDVPNNVPEGITLMRVATDAGGGFDDACERIHYGEVEDYLVTVR